MQRLEAGLSVHDLEDDRRQEDRVRTAQSLLREGRSSLLKGFESKSGKPFEARLKMDGAEVRFDFST